MSAVEDLGAERAAKAGRTEGERQGGEGHHQDGADDEDGPGHRKQADRLVDLAHASKIELWHTPGGEEAYVTFEADGHKENWPLRSKVMRLWLRRLFFEAFHSAPAAQAVADALEQLRAEALFCGKEQEAYIRVGNVDADIYIDLANERWEQVVVRPTGTWEIIDASNSPIRFRRTKGMLKLPTPVAGGKLGELRNFINVERDEDWVLLVTFLLCCLRFGRAFWLLVLVGEQGTGKSICAELLRRLVDPNTVPLRSAPRDERDLSIAARNGWLVCLDNLSGLDGWASDALCRLLSGAGFSTRTLYENDEEELFAGGRPVIANGIADLLGRPDLADRAISILLGEIKQRKTEEELRSSFEAALPRILGALYSTMAAALSHLPAVRSTATALARMADVHLLGLAVEPAMKWPSGTFERAYRNNRREIIGQTLDADACALALRAWFEDRKRRKWKGTASELLKALENFAPDGTKRGSEWPRTGSSLSGRLRRAAPFLRTVGIEVVLPRKSTKGKRVMRIHRITAEKSATAATPATYSGAQPAVASGEKTSRSAAASLGGAPGGAGWRPETGSATQKDAGSQVDDTIGGAGGAPARPSSPSNGAQSHHSDQGADQCRPGNGRPVIDVQQGETEAQAEAPWVREAAVRRIRADRAEVIRLRRDGRIAEADTLERAANEAEKRLADGATTQAGGLW
jgi:hypothetical protein